MAEKKEKLQRVKVRYSNKVYLDRPERKQMRTAMLMIKEGMDKVRREIDNIEVKKKVLVLGGGAEGKECKTVDGGKPNNRVNTEGKMENKRSRMAQETEEGRENWKESK